MPRTSSTLSMQVARFIEGSEAPSGRYARAAGLPAWMAPNVRAGRVSPETCVALMSISEGTRDGIVNAYRDGSSMPSLRELRGMARIYPRTTGERARLRTLAATMTAPAAPVRRPAAPYVPAPTSQWDASTALASLTATLRAMPQGSAHMRDLTQRLAEIHDELQPYAEATVAA